MSLLQQTLTIALKYANAFKDDAQACFNELTALQNGWKDYAELIAKCPEARAWKVTDASTVSISMHVDDTFRLTITNIEDGDSDPDEVHFYILVNNTQGDYTVSF